MIERIYELLKEEKSGLSAADICRRVLGVVQISEVLSERIVAGLLNDDGRFTFAQGRWQAREEATQLHRSFSRLTYVVVDVETTGMVPGEHRVTEIGAVKIEDGVIQETFNSLVNPGRPIPIEITGLTGITQEMVMGAPMWAGVCPFFLHFLGDAVLVAHNVPFDLGFINSELRLVGEAELGNETICTLKLARRLIKGLPDHRLETVATHYAVSVEGRHRGLGDALMAAKILLIFLNKFQQMGLSTLGDIKALEKGS